MDVRTVVVRGKVGRERIVLRVQERVLVPALKRQRKKKTVENQKIKKGSPDFRFDGLIEQVFLFFSQCKEQKIVIGKIMCYCYMQDFIEKKTQLRS